MDTRREFLKKAFLLSGVTGLSGTIPPSIQRAIAIDPASGSTYLDAEHVVVLMQENRSFDHCFGSLRGVRGFNDPRAITLPNGNTVWLQSNEDGETYAPFRFNIRDTKITWMGAVPHSRDDQVDAYNRGKYDKWLEAKRSRNNKYSNMPLTLGHYNREDLPFHYSMAEAFTICDQNFCSAMTSTTPNRMFLWSGTIRGDKSADARAFIRNAPYKDAPHWKAFPERLEENGISWKVYQNEITTGRGFNSQDEQSWLSNFGCNVLEYLSQYHVKFHPRYVRSLQKRMDSLSDKVKELEKKIASAPEKSQQYVKLTREVAKKKEVLRATKKELVKWSTGNFHRLSRYQKNLYLKAFTTNVDDPDFMELTTLNYKGNNNEERSLHVPKGDVLYQFRKDVDTGQLPTVSWVTPPQNFSDHPSAPWYGAWFTSEILDILTKKPELWKKTIFILTYDENDGYFDHIPPFVAPDPKRPETGKCSPGVNTTGAEYIYREQEVNEGVSKRNARTGPIGLGYRVPMIIASPWSRGGKVCSEIFDHTSVFQFLEEFLNKKFNKDIRQTNTTAWRRTVCGNLTSAFSLFEHTKNDKVEYISKNSLIKDLHSAQFKKTPSSYKVLSGKEIEQINQLPSSSSLMPRQEPGIRLSCPLPYQLYADGSLSDDGKKFVITMQAKKEVFGERSAGAPFKVYAPGNHLALKENQAQSKKVFEACRSWDYAVKAGDLLTDTWLVDAFENGTYLIRLYGPNGFFREFSGSARDPRLRMTCEYERKRFMKSKPTGNLVLKVMNLHPGDVYRVKISDNAYKHSTVHRTIAGGEEDDILLNLKNSLGWYDFTVTVSGYRTFATRYAGRVETGKEGFSDPAMGRRA